MDQHNNNSYDYDYDYYDNTTIDLYDAYTPYEQRPETYIVPVLFFVIFVVGVLGNGSIIMIFLKHKAIRNVLNTYIFSLALADLLVIITCVPFTSILYTMEYWPWGVVVCKISETAKDISIGVSVFTLTALSAQRYFAIVNPLRRFQNKPTMTTVICIGMLWILAAALALPSAICSRLDKVEFTSNETITFCTPFPDITNAKTYAKYNVVLKSLIYYIIPLCIIAFFYVLMAIRLHASANEMPGEIKGTQSVAQARTRRHVTRIVFIFVFLFFICFLPYHVFMLWFHLHPQVELEYDAWWHAFRIMGFCLSFLHSCVNPVALYCISGVFRAHINRYLYCQDLRNKNSAENYEMDFNH